MKATATSLAPQHHSTAFLSQSTSLRLALIILNTEHRSSKGGARDLFSHLWDEASVRVCADGAANRLHDALSQLFGTKASEAKHSMRYISQDTVQQYAQSETYRALR